MRNLLGILFCAVFATNSAFATLGEKYDINDPVNASAQKTKVTQMQKHWVHSVATSNMAVKHYVRNSDNVEYKFSAYGHRPVDVSKYLSSSDFAQYKTAFHLQKQKARKMSRANVYKFGTIECWSSGPPNRILSGCCDSSKTPNGESCND